MHILSWYWWSWWGTETEVVGHNSLIMLIKQKFPLLWVEVTKSSIGESLKTPNGEGNGNPLQCSCLENPRDGVAQSRTRLKWLSSSNDTTRASIWIPELTEVNTWIVNSIPELTDKREFSLALAKRNGLSPFLLILSWSWSSRIQQKHNKGVGLKKRKSQVKKRWKYRLYSTAPLKIFKPWVSPELGNGRNF